MCHTTRDYHSKPDASVTKDSCKCHLGCVGGTEQVLAHLGGLTAAFFNIAGLRL